MSARADAAQHLRRARLALVEAHREGEAHDEMVRAYNELMMFCQRHRLVEHDEVQPAAPRLRSVA